MQKNFIQPDGYTYSILFNALKLKNCSSELIKSTLDKVFEIINNGEMEVDEIIFNSVFEICLKYDFLDDFKKYCFDEKLIPDGYKWMRAVTVGTGVVSSVRTLTRMRRFLVSDRRW